MFFWFKILKLVFYVNKVLNLNIYYLSDIERIVVLL